MRTRAVLDGDEWVVDGAKIWTSGAADGDFVYLISRTDPDAPAHRGISEIIVALDSPGITVTPIRDMTGARHFCEVHFEGVRVPATNLVGELNGSWRQVMRQLEHERGGVDRLVSNLALYRDTLEVADRCNFSLDELHYAQKAWGNSSAIDDGGVGPARSSLRSLTASA